MKCNTILYAIAIMFGAYMPNLHLQRVEGRLFKPMMAWTVAFALFGGDDLRHSGRTGL